MSAHTQALSDPAVAVDAKRIGAAYRMLRKRDPGGLFVAAPPAAGHEVVECGDGPCGADTLRAYESMIALHRAAILQAFRHSSERRVVCEIATGNPEFGYQFKTYCGHVTYLICGPDAVVSRQAAVLRAALPAARADDDFIFLPQSSGPSSLPDRIDLLVLGRAADAAAMPAVDAYLAHAHAVECPFVYGVNLCGADAAEDSQPVDTIVNRYYWLRTFSVLPGGHEPSRPSTHVVGWRRARAA